MHTSKEKAMEMLESKDWEMVALGITLAIPNMETRGDYNKVKSAINRIPGGRRKNLRRLAQSKHYNNIQKQKNAKERIKLAASKELAKILCA
jgi:hypothetical protein